MKISSFYLKSRKYELYEKWQLSKIYEKKSLASFKDAARRICVNACGKTYKLLSMNLFIYLSIMGSHIIYIWGFVLENT